MTDPLGILRQPLVPLAPDPAFAAHLRARIQRALTEGGTMPAFRELAASEGDLAYFSLQVDDAARARHFYGAVLGWRFGADDESGHSAQVEGQALPLGIWDGPPSPGARKPGVLLVHRVADLAASTAAVRALGGTASEPHRETYGLAAECADDQGNGFTLLEMPPETPRPPANGGRPGDVVYITISPGDEVRASEFFTSLFGWRFTAGSVSNGLQVSGPAPMMGLWGGLGRQSVTLMYLVDDITAAVRRVRDAGGTAADPEQQPYGITSDCVDDQGMAFSLGQL
jgi:predicted enzyme related to lactoylglutathione lyase